MLVRLYERMWIVGILAVGLFYVMGDLTPVATVVFGFLAVTVVFMGMMSVLPGVIHDNLSRRSPSDPDGGPHQFFE